MSRLDDIVAQKRREVAALHAEGREEALNGAAAGAPVARSLREALLKGRPSVIAEVKRASPSRGVITGDFHPSDIARAYERGGANAVSVLTDERFFAGSNEHLKEVRQAISIPVLRKDFVIDPMQVVEARALGADAVLLIVRLLDDDSLRGWRELALSLGMDALVEAHDETEVRRAIDSGATLIGVNNRDLSTFTVDLTTSERLRRLIPSGVVTVSESGILSSEDAVRMFSVGYDAVLVGEGLLTAADRAVAVRSMKEHAGAGSLR